MEKILSFFNTDGVDQVKNSFDKKTIVKIVKGALIAGTGAAAIYILTFVGSMEFSDANVSAAVAFAVPFLINTIKEFVNGK